MDAKSISELLGGKISGKGYIACCPAHDDKNPSLSINEMDGKILLKCWAGCSVESIVSTLGIEMKDLFPESRYSLNQLKQHRRKIQKHKLINALYQELLVLIQFVSTRYTDNILKKDHKFKEARPEFRPMPDEPWERELLAAKRIKIIIGDLYDL